MCFSANASFTAGAVLSTIGVVCLKKVQTPSHKLFAAIPLIFAAQQITEGFLWLALSRNNFSSLQHITTYLFLFFAQVVWPTWVPFSILKLQPKEKQKTIEKILLGIGIGVSAYLAYCLITYTVEAQIQGYHIAYIQSYPATLSKYGGILYVIATVSPPFFSRIKYMWLLGASILTSYIITTIFYTDYIVSVWCFFASIISIAVLGVLYGIKKEKH